MRVIDFGLMVIMILAVIESRSTMLLVPLALGYIMGMTLNPTYGYHTYAYVNNMKMRIFMTALIGVMCGTMDVGMAIIAYWLSYFTNYVAEKIVRLISRATGCFHITVFVTATVTMIICSNNVCGYLMAGVVIGYMFSVIDYMVLNTKSNCGGNEQ